MSGFVIAACFFTLHFRQCSSMIFIVSVYISVNIVSVYISVNIVSVYISVNIVSVYISVNIAEEQAYGMKTVQRNADCRLCWKSKKHISGHEAQGLKSSKHNKRH